MSIASPLSHAPAPTTAAPASPAVEQPSSVHPSVWLGDWEMTLLPLGWRGKP
jgi:hypothetical protein